MRSRNVSPGFDADAHDDPVGQHARAAGHRREVAAGLADDRRRFAGDRALVDRGDAFDDLAVERDRRRRPRPARRRPCAARRPRCGCHGAPCFGALELLGDDLASSCRAALAACALLRPSASASAKLANSTVNQSHSATARMNPAGASPLPRERLDAEHGRQDAADVDDEHHRVAPLHARVELGERVADRRPHERRVEQRERRVAGRMDHGAHLADKQRRGARRPGRARAPARSSARRRAATVPISSTTNSGPCVGSVPAVTGNALLRRERAGDREHRHDHARSGRTTSRWRASRCRTACSPRGRRTRCRCCCRPS